MTTSVPPSAPRRPALTPTGGYVHVVRWDRLDGHGARQRYYRRMHDAQKFADLLAGRGFNVAVYSSPVDWGPAS